MNIVEKRRLWIFIAIAYGVTAVMSIFMFIGLRKEYNLTVFVNTQMFYPACGVILGKLITRKEDESLPVGGYITVLVSTAFMMILSICSVFGSGKMINLPGMSISPWDLGSQFIMMISSIVAYILFWTCGKKKREDAGLNRKNIAMSILMIVIFIILYFARFLISATLSDAVYHTSESMDMLKGAVSNSRTWVMAFALLPTFFITFLAFFGEEYGWRYYLQPVMLQKFGLRKGVILLGLVWALWHLNVCFMFYSVETGPLMFVSQIITCVTVGIFFGYAYMKTQNIWVPVIMHYLNNNLIAVITGGDSSVLQNQIVHGKDIPIMIIQGLVFALFIFAPIYGKKLDKKAN